MAAIFQDGRQNYVIKTIWAYNSIFFTDFSDINVNFYIFYDADFNFQLTSGTSKMAAIAQDG